MHVSLYVSSIAQTVNFYTSFFGVPAVKIKSNYAKYILESPSLIISFVENKDRVQSNFGHLGFQVESPEKLYELLTAAKAKGFVTREEMATNCCYAKQDKFWVNDPDGVQWEVYYFHEDAEFNDPHFEMAEANACCMPDADVKENIQLSELQKDAQCCDKTTGCC
jgi:catechol 2,3-dioxygenase-like lactoylglutathione lyase family enzyme